MNICCLIDSLGPGGAQRQMTGLIHLLAAAGNQVRLVNYHREHRHFLHEVIAAGVEPEYIDSKTRIGRVWKIRRAIRAMKPDCLISFLDSPNMMAVAASIGRPRIPVIVSERALDIQGKTWRNRARFNWFRMATRIVANSTAQSRFICTHFPFLASKTRTIINCVDLEKFSPVPDAIPDLPRRLIIGASVIPEKNVIRFIEALGMASRRVPRGSLLVDWFGSSPAGEGETSRPSACESEAMALRDRLDLQHCLRFHPKVNDLHLRFRHFHAACLPSVFEGCPNFICEAMSCGLPVLASEVSDLSMIVGPSEPDTCGQLFDPLSVPDIADALVRFTVRDREELIREGLNARQRAERLFSPAVFTERYVSLIREIAK